MEWSRLVCALFELELKALLGPLLTAALPQFANTLFVYGR